MACFLYRSKTWRNGHLDPWLIRPLRSSPLAHVLRSHWLWGVQAVITTTHLSHCRIQTSHQVQMFNLLDIYRASVTVSEWGMR